MTFLKSGICLLSSVIILFLGTFLKELKTESSFLAMNLYHKSFDVIFLRVLNRSIICWSKVHFFLIFTSLRIRLITNISTSLSYIITLYIIQLTNTVLVCSSKNSLFFKNTVIGHN